MPKYPDVTVQLLGMDGNIFSILGRTAKALRRAGVSDEEIHQMTDEVTSQHNYYDALGVVEQWVEVA